MAVGGLGSTLWFYIGRAVDFLRVPAIAILAGLALVVLFNIGVLTGAGLVLQRVQGALIVVGIIGLGARLLLATNWSHSWRWVLMAAIAVGAILGTVGGFVVGHRRA